MNGPGTRFVPGPFHTTTDSCSVPTISARHAEPIREIRGIARVIRVRPFPTRTGRDADPSRPDALIAIRLQVPAYLHESSKISRGALEAREVQDVVHERQEMHLRLCCLRLELFRLQLQLGCLILQERIPLREPTGRLGLHVVVVGEWPIRVSSPLRACPNRSQPPHAWLPGYA